MIEFFDMDTNEVIRLAILDIKEITTNADGNILIENIDGIFFRTDKVIF